MKEEKQMTACSKGERGDYSKSNSNCQFPRAWMQGEFLNFIWDCYCDSTMIEKEVWKARQKLLGQRNSTRTAELRLGSESVTRYLGALTHPHPLLVRTHKPFSILERLGSNYCRVTEQHGSRFMKEGIEGANPSGSDFILPCFNDPPVVQGLMHSEECEWNPWYAVSPPQLRQMQSCRGSLIHI